MSAPATAVIVPARYCGPRTSGNGGWTSGAVARLLGCGPGDAAEVRLHLPPPLGVGASKDEVYMMIGRNAAELCKIVY